MNLEELKQLTTAQDAAQRKAAPAVKAAHQKALEAAHDLHETLTESMVEDVHRAKLKAIIESAAREQFSSKPDLQMAGIVLGQHAAALPPMPGVPEPISRSGRNIIARAINGTASYSPEQRAKILAAIIIGVLGQTETGLIEFPSEWHTIPSLPDLWQWASFLNEEAVNALRAEDEAREAELLEVQRLADVLGQATPSLYAVGTSGEAMVVTLRNNRGGPSGLGNGIVFQPGDNFLDAKQLAAARKQKGFDKAIESGTFEITHTTKIVEQL